MVKKTKKPKIIQDSARRNPQVKDIIDVQVEHITETADSDLEARPRTSKD